MLRAVVLTQYRRVTDGQTDRRTDGIAVANTALAMRALRALYKVQKYKRVTLSVVNTWTSSLRLMLSNVHFPRTIPAWNALPYEVRLSNRLIYLSKISQPQEHRVCTFIYTCVMHRWLLLLITGLGFATLKPRLHDTTGCQSGCQTGLTTVLNEQPLFVQPVVKPGCTTGLTTVCIV